MPKVKEAYEGQVLIDFQPKTDSSGSNGFLNSSHGYFPVPECIIGAVIFKLWRNPHIDNSMVGKANCK